MAGERQVIAAEDAGGLAAGGLAAASARVGRIDEAAPVVDHLPQGAPCPRDALPERLAGAAQDLGTVGVG
jgi:hypothetical protein